MKMTDKINKTMKGDVAHSVGKGLLGAVPVIGSLASEIFGLIVTPPLEKRRADWMYEIAKKLKELENNQKIDFKELAENEQFIDVVLQATTLALKTSEKKKIDCFKNAILNTAVGKLPDKTKSQIFLNQLDRFIVWHIIILDFINSPRNWFKKNGKTPPNDTVESIYSIIAGAFPDLKNQDELLDIIWDDLKRTGFHRAGNLKTWTIPSRVLNDGTTTLGREFLKFITNENE